MVSNSHSNMTPTDEELLQVFLYNKIHNKPLPTNLNILEYDLYGRKNPWEIWEEFQGSYSYGGKDLYFFTTLKKKTPTSSRSVRTIGLGSWEGEDTGKLIFSKDEDTKYVLGIKKRFRFEKSDTYQDGGWLMHEYSLNISLTGEPSYSSNVLCRFRKNMKYATHNTSMENSSQARQEMATTVLERPPPIPKPHNNVLSREDIFHDLRAELPNCVDRPKVIETCTKKEEEDCVQIIDKKEFIFTAQKRTLVLGLAATTERNTNNVCLGKNNHQGSIKQPDGREKTGVVSKRNQPSDGDKTGVDETSPRKKGKYNKEEEIEKQEEDDDLTMSWPELFAMQLRQAGEGCLTDEEEEEIEMLPNNFAKDILSEYIDIK